MRAKAKPAQVGGGDPRVLAHPSFREIPDCLFPLQTDKGQAEYDTLARMLFDAGKFSLATHRALSSYAIQFDTVTKAVADGVQVRGSWFTQMERARRQLKLNEIDKPVASPVDAKANPFARVGFSARRR